MAKTFRRCTRSTFRTHCGPPVEEFLPTPAFDAALVQTDTIFTGATWVCPPSRKWEQWITWGCTSRCDIAAGLRECLYDCHPRGRLAPSHSAPHRRRPICPNPHEWSWRHPSGLQKNKPRLSLIKTSATFISLFCFQAVVFHNFFFFDHPPPQPEPRPVSLHSGWAVKTMRRDETAAMPPRRLC